MGKTYTAEEYRAILKMIYDMNSEELRKVFGSVPFFSDYVKDFSASELIEKYRAYINMPKTGEYWKNNGDEGMVVVRYVERGLVRYYRCNNGTSNCLSVDYFTENFTRTEHKSRYLDAFLEEMEEVSK